MGKEILNKEISDSKKLILLYLQELFLEKTDKTHFITIADINNYLEQKEIYADRKTIYANIKLLNYFGFEIVGTPSKDKYYYNHPDRLFDENELKFLIDSVVASKFLTQKKLNELINKIKSLASIHEREHLNRSVLVGNRIKSMNDKIFKNLDTIYSALNSNSQITFQYMRWNPQKKLEYIKGGNLICVSPFAVSLTNENYYLVAYEKYTNILKHYRIDKMSSIKLTADRREGKDIYKSFDIVDYTRKTFSMFGGEEETVSIECSNKLIGVFIDRFGDNISIRPSFDKTDFSVVRINVNVSLQFFAWIFGLGTEVKILSPESVIYDFKQTVTGILSNYQP